MLFRFVFVAGILLTVAAQNSSSRSDSSTIAIAVRFEHSSPLKNVGNLRSMLNKFIGRLERDAAVEQVLLAEFGGSERDVTAIRVSTAGSEHAIGEEIDKLGTDAAADEAKAESLAGIASRIRTISTVSTVVVMFADLNSGDSIVGPKMLEETGRSASEALANGADVVVFLRSYQESKTEPLGIHCYRMSTSPNIDSVIHEYGTDADIVSSKLRSLVHEKFEKQRRMKPRTKRKTDACTYDECYFRSVNATRCMADLKIKPKSSNCAESKECNRDECEATCDNLWDKSNCSESPTCRSKAQRIQGEKKTQYCMQRKKRCLKEADCETVAKDGMLVGVIIFGVLLVLSVVVVIGAIAFGQTRKKPTAKGAAVGKTPSVKSASPKAAKKSVEFETKSPAGSPKSEASKSEKDKSRSVKVSPKSSVKSVKSVKAK